MATKMTKEEAINKVRQMSLPKETMEILQALAPELAESEDERIRKLLIWQVHLNIEDETNDLAQSVYDGIKGHDPDLEESIEDWKKCLAYLEKQKDSTSNNFDDVWNEEDCEEIIAEGQKLTPRFKELLKEVCHAWYDRGAKLEKQKEQNLIMANSPQLKEQKPVEWSKDIIRKAVKEVGLTQHQIDWFKTNVFPPKQEWSEEDKKTIDDAYCWLCEYAGSLIQRNYGKSSMLYGIANKLKSLHSQPKQEWSEEDEANRTFILESLEDQIRFCKKDAKGAYYTKQIRTAQNWLKSLSLNLKKKNEDVAKLCSNE